jgi:nucleotide-binding universal stress UspA family protein
VLLPLFFAYSGLRTSIGLLDTAGEWALTMGIIAVATLGKFGGTALAARLSGLGAREAAAVGTLMNTRGLMELVVLNIGLDLGVLTPQLFAMLVLMALVTTWTTTPALARILPATVLQAHAEAVTRDTFAPARPAPLPLVCVADAGVAPSMLALARTLSPAGVRALHLRPLARFSETMHADTQDSDPLDAVREEARAHGIHVEALGFASASPAEDIARIAAETQAPFVLLGAHRSAFAGDSMGGNVARVIQRAGCDVLVLVDRGLLDVRRIRIVQPDSRAAGDLDARAVHRLAERLRASGVEVHEQADPDGACEGADLVVAPHTVAPPLDPRCSWVAVCAGRAEADPVA